LTESRISIYPDSLKNLDWIFLKKLNKLPASICRETNLCSVRVNLWLKISLLHPDNRHIRDKIRQRLQVLRDAGLLLQVERGVWRFKNL
jgi:DpnI-like restriction endonuclease